MKKNILLIGGSYGIGLAVAKQLQERHSLYIASRTKDGLHDINGTHIPFDVLTDTLDTSLLPDKIDGFVYCPGSIDLKPFKMLNLETFEADMQLNFFGLIKVLKTVIPNLAEGASMVFFSTVAVSIGMPFHTSVAASKGAIEGFAKAMAAEYAPKLRVNVVAPSLTATPLAKRLLNNDRKKEAMAQRHPLKRIGPPEDIANMVTFLLDSKSDWMTGQVINIDGGMSTLNIS